LEIGSEKKREGSRMEGEKRGEQEWAKAYTRPPLGVSVDLLLRLVVLVPCGVGELLNVLAASGSSRLESQN